MGHAGLDEDEIAGLVFDDFFQTLAVFMAHFALEDVEHQLEVDMDVGEGDGPGWDGGDVHGEKLAADVLFRHAGLVADAVPGARTASTADAFDSFVAFDDSFEIVPVFCHVCLYLLSMNRFFHAFGLLNGMFIENKLLLGFYLVSEGRLFSGFSFDLPLRVARHP